MAGAYVGAPAEQRCFANCARSDSTFGHRDGFLQRTDLELQVTLDVLSADGQFAGEGGKAGQLRFKHVFTWRKAGKFVAPLAVRLHFELCPSLGICHRELHAGQHRVGRIDNQPAQAR